MNVYWDGGVCVELEKLYHVTLVGDLTRRVGSATGAPAAFPVQVDQFELREDLVCGGLLM